MIILSTDFGIEGPYVGQVKATIYHHAPDCKVIDLFSDLPPYRPKACAALIAAYSNGFPVGSVFLCVVDPGVGMADREGVVIKADDRWFVGPDNGLFDVVMSDDPAFECWAISWQPESLSNTFHGRDLFAPIAAALANGIFPDDKLRLMEKSRGPVISDDDNPQVVYIDHFGNIMTNLRGDRLRTDVVLVIADRKVRHALTYGDVEAGAVFWYKNSNGLVEVAVNCGSAAKFLDVSVGDQVLRA